MNHFFFPQIFPLTINQDMLFSPIKKCTIANDLVFPFYSYITLRFQIYSLKLICIIKQFQECCHFAYLTQSCCIVREIIHHIFSPFSLISVSCHISERIISKSPIWAGILNSYRRNLWKRDNFFYTTQERTCIIKAKRVRERETDEINTKWIE